MSTSSPALWYLVRGTGLVDLVLLTAVCVLGISEVVRYTRPGWPRFVVAALHRNVAVLALALLAVHIASSVADSYVSIALIDVFVPFVGTYHPLWLGLGALATDLLVAIAITSALRRRIGRRAWRAVHVASYACWPLAVAHGLGMGTDRVEAWVWVLNGLCVAAVAAAVAWRAAAVARGLSRPGRPAVRFPSAVSGWSGRRATGT